VCEVVGVLAALFGFLLLIWILFTWGRLTLFNKKCMNFRCDVTY
jgi:hypothetical protein